MIQIFALHSPHGLATAVAALDGRLIRPASQRILVSVHQTKVPETSPALHESDGLQTLRARFGRVESLNDLIAPQHPSAWAPNAQDLPMLERLLRRAWGIGDEPVELYVQSPQVAPATTLMAVFEQAALHIVGDGLMTYSPIRDRVPRRVSERIADVLHADIVPGVRPLVFAETGAPRVAIEADALRPVLAETADARDVLLDGLAEDRTPTALVLGQYLAALGIVTAAEEQRMQADMIARAAAWGVRRIVFRPHPSAPPALTAGLRDRAGAAGLAFAVHDGDTPAEIVAERLGAIVVVAGFSTALPTVRALSGIPIAASGLTTVLRRLRPYENSNRVPVVIVDALTRADSPYAEPERLQLLVDAVGYVMQPRIVAHLRPRAEEFLAALDERERRRYFDAQRLRRLGLPGAAAPTALQRTLESRGGVDRIEELRLTANGARRRARRIWKAVRGR